MTEKKSKNLKRKLAHVAGWQVVRRAAKSLPPFGSLVAIGFVGYDIKKKGLVKGIINSGLDAIPLIGAGKNVIELFTGDFLADRTAGEPVKKLPEKGKI